LFGTVESVVSGTLRVRYQREVEEFLAQSELFDLNRGAAG
jgi:hypothetical protein